MPCRSEPCYPAQVESLEREKSRLKERLDAVTDMLCATLTHYGPPPERLDIEQWWARHKAWDERHKYEEGRIRKAREQARRSEGLRRSKEALVALPGGQDCWKVLSRDEEHLLVARDHLRVSVRWPSHSWWTVIVEDTGLDKSLADKGRKIGNILAGLLGQFAMLKLEAGQGDDA